MLATSTTTTRSRWCRSRKSAMSRGEPLHRLGGGGRARDVARAHLGVDGLEVGAGGVHQGGWHHAARGQLLGPLGQRVGADVVAAEDQPRRGPAGRRAAAPAARSRERWSVRGHAPRRTHRPPLWWPPSPAHPRTTRLSWPSPRAWGSCRPPRTDGRGPSGHQGAIRGRQAVRTRSRTPRRRPRSARRRRAGARTPAPRGLRRDGPSRRPPTPRRSGRRSRSC